MPGRVGVGGAETSGAGAPKAPGTAMGNGRGGSGPSGGRPGGPPDGPNPGGHGRRHDCGGAVDEPVGNVSFGPMITATATAIVPSNISQNPIL